MTNARVDPDSLRLLKSTHIFKTMPGDVFKRIAANCQWKKYKKNAEIFSKGDPADGFYIIDTGEVEIIAGSEDGRQIILNVMGKKDFFGEIALIDQDERTASAVAATNTRVLFLPRREWLNLMKDLDRESLISLLLNLCKLFRRSSQRLEDAYFIDKRKRLLMQLALLCQEQETNSQSNKPLKVVISQNKLAKMVGITREFTNKILSHCERCGILETGHGFILILDYCYLQLYTKGEISENQLFNVA